jgi:hypothetical protein
MGDPERQVAEPADDRRARLDRRLRQAFIEGAEDGSRRRFGRGLSRDELEWVPRDDPGDVARLRREA